MLRPISINHHEDEIVGAVGDGAHGGVAALADQAERQAENEHGE